MSYTFTNENLNADILKQKVPLSEAITKAITPSGRSGIQWGFNLKFNTPNWPAQPRSTDTGLAIVITPGAALVPMDSATTKRRTSILLPATLTDSISLFIGSSTGQLNILTTDTNDYYIVLRGYHTNATVQDTTGFIVNAGSQRVELEVLTKAEYLANGANAIVLGGFNLNADAIWSSADMIYGDKGVIVTNAPADLAVMDSDMSLDDWLQDMLMANRSNLQKHLVLNNLSFVAAESLSVTTNKMPLSNITTGEASNSGSLATWGAPIDWMDPDDAIFNGILENVSHFEIKNTLFRNSANLAFYRTPGHAKHYKKHVDSNAANCTDPSYVGGLPDYGAREFIFDASGSTFDKDLNIDLVLDFVGQPHNCRYKILIKNLTVKGNLRIRYGSAIPGLAGMAMATVEYDNVNVLGSSNEFGAWPRFEGTFNLNGATPSGNGFLTRFLNMCAVVTSMYNGGRFVTFSGFTNPSDPVLNNWRTADSSIPIGISSHGNLLLAHHHNDLTGAGALAINNPYLSDSVDGALVFKQSTVPTKVFSISSLYDTNTALVNAIRIRLQKCVEVIKDSTTVAGYPNAPTMRMVDDRVYNAFEFDLKEFRNIILPSNLTWANHKVCRIVVSQLETKVMQTLEVATATPIRVWGLFTGSPSADYGNTDITYAGGLLANDISVNEEASTVIKGYINLAPGVYRVKLRRVVYISPRTSSRIAVVAGALCVAPFTGFITNATGGIISSIGDINALPCIFGGYSPAGYYNPLTTVSIDTLLTVPVSSVLAPLIAIVPRSSSEPTGVDYSVVSNDVVIEKLT